ncbi:MAG: 8-oxo-dGTP diphosphatase [Bacilli bacterium]|nr:8-oxo-dGTP diphosphatase [Bacilli bacterium]
MNGGKWIGVGGKIEPNETPLEGIIRELKEETGLDLKSAKLRAKLYFYNNDYGEVIYQYTSEDFEGELIDCDEGTLKWVPFDQIMFLPLWEGDKEFLPLLINEKTPYFEMDLIYKNDKFVKCSVNRSII